MHLGLKIKIARVAKRLTQQELADKINKTRPLISHIEQTGKVNYYTLKAICEVLEIAPEDLDETARLVSEPYEMSEVIRLRNENQLLRQEVQMLKDIVNEQKALIKSLLQPPPK